MSSYDWYCVEDGRDPEEFSVQLSLRTDRCTSHNLAGSYFSGTKGKTCFVHAQRTTASLYTVLPVGRG